MATVLRAIVSRSLSTFCVLSVDWLQLWRCWLGAYLEKNRPRNMSSGTFNPTIRYHLQLFMPLPSLTGRWRRYVLVLSVRSFVRPSVCLLPNLWTWYF